MQRLFMIIALAMSLTGNSASPDELERLGPRLAQVRRFAAQHGERLWTGYGSAPFGVLLLGKKAELLLCQHPMPPGFAPASRDEATGCLRSRRPRTELPDTLLAAMPLFGPPSTIVMGTPASTGRSLADWTRTILHEHFHQWQSELPDYFSRTDALNLKGGDESGMWMLNYPFPYDDVAIGRSYRAASLALSEALEARGRAGFRGKLDRFLLARGEFERSAGPANWRYIELQLWQEGVARWTEIELAKHHPAASVRTDARNLEAATLARLLNPDLKVQRRELAYSLGAGEAWLMEACGPAWRKHYPKHLALGPVLAASRADCAAR